MNYIKIDKTKATAEFAGDTLRVYGDWIVLVTSGCGVLSLHDDGSSIYGWAVKTPESSSYDQVMAECVSVYTEADLIAMDPPDWQWLMGSNDEMQADGRPGWAIRQSIAGYQ